MRRLAVSLLLFATPLAWAADPPPPKMKFNEVREIAPGVFFRYSSISPDNSVAFGGSNHTWVVFEDYVVVIDANFPKEAGDVIAAIRKTTNKPIRYVLDTHHHGDHAYGNAVWAQAGATIVAHRNCARIMRLYGAAEFAAAGKGPGGRKDIAASSLKVPSLIFDDKLVLDDGKQRVEFYQFGHSHTIGDAVAYLPKHKILCTGDACVNGPYNFMGHSDSASWIRSLERMQQLDVKLVCPGHGLPVGPELLAKQRRYFVDLRQAVKKGIEDGKELADIQKAIDLPWYKDWTTVKPAADNVKHVYNELLGLVSPPYPELTEDGPGGPSPTKDSPGWTKPKRIVVPSGLMPGRLLELKRAAPEAEIVSAKTAEQAAKLVEDADAVLGFATADVIRAGKKLRWVQAPPGEIAADALLALQGKAITLTATNRVEAPRVADQTFALLLALTRNLLGKGKMPPVELRGKTLLVVGGGMGGEEITRRAAAFGTRVRFLDDSRTEKPAGAFSLEKLDKLAERLAEADVVVLALPLTAKTRGAVGAKQLQAMKKGAFLINAAHPALVDLDALARTLDAKSIAGAGLDLTEGAAQTLGKRDNVVLGMAGAGDKELTERLWRLYRENVRRFAAGEALLEVVETAGK